MTLVNRSSVRKTSVFVIVSFFLVNTLAFAMVFQPVRASPALELKWQTSVGPYGTTVGPLAADLFGDGMANGLEIVVTGGPSDWGTDGAVTVLDGDNGNIIWQRDSFDISNIGINLHTSFDIADLNKDGIPEIIISSSSGPLVLHGNDGSLYWRNTAVPSGMVHGAVADIDGDGYPEVFVTRDGRGPHIGYEYITSLSHDGQILNQAWAWHSCWGGISVSDTNDDGRWELYQGDRSSSYNPASDPYQGGGMGLRAFDAHTLTPLWNDPSILCSSQCPILADVDKDGILDVIVAMQSSSGIAVLNSADGSVVTTGGVYRKGRIGSHSSHSQLTVADIDGDGNLEAIECRDSPVRIWDLYDWEPDATLPVSACEPPKVGDVTGDGELDIIAVVGGTGETGGGNEVYVYSYDGTDYVEVDHLTGLSVVRAFTLVQDVDGDGLNELVLSSSSGWVYCYDTPAPVPTPRARSELQFYGEGKRGAAEYDSPPTPTKPYLSDEQPHDGSLNQTLNPTLSVRAADFQGNLMNIAFGTNASGSWLEIDSYSNVPTGVYSVDPTNMDVNGTTYFWSVNATDTVTGDWTYGTYSFSTQTRPPTHDTPLLVSSGGTNGTKENLICYNQSTSDPDGNEVTNVYNWYVNDTSLTNLLLPFDIRPDTSVHPLFADGFEVNFDKWNDYGATNWDRTESQAHSGSWSAQADSDATFLTSNDVDTSMAGGFTVSFWYRDDDIDDDDNVYLQFWDGSSYNNIFELGNTSPEDEWHHYSIWYRAQFEDGDTITNLYAIPDFHIRFDAHLLDSGENLWIDDVTIMLDDGTADVQAKDYSGYDNHGAVTGATYTSNGIVGGAYVFDGDDRIMVEENGNSLGGDGSWSEISVEFWVKATTNTGTERLIWKHDDGDIGYRVEFGAQSATNYIRWRVYTPSTQQAYYYIDEGPRSWHHVVCTYESGVGLKIYVDGVEKASTSASGNIQATVAGPLEIGYYSGSGDFAGMLDEVRIYPRAITPFQVSQRYVETKDGLSSNSTIAWQETQVGDVWKCQVTPNDGFVEGEPLFSDTLVIQPSSNTPPEAGNLTITPLSPTTTDDLTASYDYFDADGDPEYGSEIMWYKDDVLQSDLKNSPTVSSSLTAKGEEWYFTVRPNDFVELGDLQTSPTASIVNALPSFTDVYITPDPAFDTSTLTANPYGWVDDDGDPEGYVYQWQILDGGSWEDIVGETSQTLTSDNFERGDTVRVNCTAFDGEDNGMSDLDAMWIVDSDPPTHDTPLLVSSHGTNRADEELICYNQTTTDPDGDEVTNIYHWIRDGDSLTTLLMPFDTNSSATARDYSGYGNDGTVFGATWTSDGVVGGAYEFDGDDVIEIPDAWSLGGNDDWSEISVELWVRPSALVRGTRIISRARPGSTGCYMIGFQTSAPDPYNTLFWGIDSTDEGWADISESPDWDPENDGLVLEVGKWYHVFGTYQSGPGLAIYINGVERFNMPLTGNLDSSSGQTLFLGYDGGGPSYRYLSGTLDEVRIYPMALTSAQIFQRYIETKDGFTSSSTIVPQETTAGDVWTCEVIPNDSWQDGIPKTSNSLEVLMVPPGQNSRPRIDFYSPTGTTPEVDEGEDLDFTHVSSDLDGDPLSYSWLLDDLEQATSQNWTYTPGYEEAGLHNVTLIVSDGDLFDSQQWNVTVNDVNGPPVIDTYYPLADPTILEGESQEFNVTYHDPDPDVLTVEWYLNGSPAGSDDFYIFNADFDSAGVYNVTVVISDLAGLFDLQQWNLSVLEAYMLTINVFGNGSVTRDPDQLSYTYGTEVNLTAIPDIGWAFSQWSGDLTGSENPKSIVIDGNKVVNATFIQEEYTLTINVFGNGSVTQDPNQLNYTYGTEVNLTAVPDLGWAFLEWTGDLTGSLNPDTIVMNGNKTVNATFVQEEYTLTINVFGNGTVALNATWPYYYGDVVELNATADADWMFLEWTGDLTSSLNPDTIVINGNKTVNATFVKEKVTLTINVFGNGTVNRDPDQLNYTYGAEVNLTAVADLGWAFSEWSGDLSGSENPTSIVMAGDKVVNATFVQEIYSLTVNVEGGGIVNLNDTWPYYYGDVVELTAVADVGWLFSLWSGDLSGSANPETLVMNANKTVTSTFTQIEYTLTVNVFGNGSVSRNNTDPYYYGDVVELTAIPDLGWAFLEWTGDLTGSLNPDTIVINGNRTVNATFIQEEYTLEIHVFGNGTVARNATWPYYYGDVVELNATADADWMFLEWTGDLTGSLNPDTIVMNGNKTVNATFVKEKVTLTINVFGNGTVNRDPNQLNYTYGAEVNLTAVADPGWSFIEWSGDLTGSENPATIVMDGDKVVNATFLQGPYNLTINEFGSGTVNRNNTGPYYYGDVVELTAVPDPGWNFTGWNEDLSGSANPETLVIDADKVVNVTFTQIEYTLTVNVFGNGTVAWNATGPYYYGDVVELNATADVGWVFSEWTGDLTGSLNPDTIVIDGDMVVNATFVQETYTLTVNVEGGGVVNLNDTGPYYYGDVVELTAVADVGWLFSLWSGDLTGSANPETLVMDGDKVVNATFIQEEYTLAINVFGNGSVTQDPDLLNYTYGAEVNLTAVADLGWSFVEWSGDLTGSENPATIVMDGDKVVNATFSLNQPPPEIVVDDVDAVFVGSWSFSSGVPGFYGEGYRYTFGDVSDTATWSFTIPVEGSWEVFARWTSHSNRATDAPYTINHAGGSTVVRVNQEVNGGVWVSLGVYSFDAGSASVMLSGDADQAVVADAIKLVPSDSPPEIVVDDVDAVFVGSWSFSSGVPGFYGEGYRYTFGDVSDTATWSFTIPVEGSWEVFARWTSHSNRATDAPYTINHAGGSTVVRVNQEVNGGVWVSLGVYSFDAGSASVMLSGDADQAVVADAIKLVRK